MKKETKKIIFIGLFTALTFLATFAIKIPSLNGYLNLGDCMVLLSGFLLGPVGGLIAGGVGSALTDFAAGYPHYILITLIVKGLEGYVAGLLFRKAKKEYYTILAALAIAIMPIGYFLTEWFVLPLIDKKYGIIAAVAGVPGNIGQAIANFVIGIALIYALSKQKKLFR